MRIGIDISQIAYEGTGVAQYVRHLVEGLLKVDKNNTYILFGASMRQKGKLYQYSHYITRKYHSSRVKISLWMLPPTLLDLLWNRLHIFPIEWFIGDVDVFISSDWTAPPTVKAKKATILYDLIVYKYPQETDKKIVETQKRRLKWVKKECDVIFCISESTKRDVMSILNIEERRLRVAQPGINKHEKV